MDKSHILSDYSITVYCDDGTEMVFFKREYPDLITKEDFVKEANRIRALILSYSK
jgi:hypothetical protein